MIDSDEVYRQIGKKLRQYRLEVGMTQEELAEKIDANSKFVGHVERFERRISLKKLAQISNVLSVPLKNFFDF